jgi:peptide/nickel transport system ATP-binding protein
VSEAHRHEAVAPDEPLLEVRDLEVVSRFGDVTNTIVSGVGLSVARGETVGIVGESGSGKSITARALMRLLPPGVEATGEVVYAGQELLALPERAMAELRGSELGLVMQDPFTMLNPLLPCGRHVDEGLQLGAGRGLTREERRPEMLRRLGEVGISDSAVAERYPFQLSGGMRQRVGIAAALARDPALLIADEPSTALDVTTQTEILSMLRSLQDARGLGVILITHDLRVAFSICDRVYVLYAGSILEVGAAPVLEHEPFHPYTLGLLLSEPPGDRRLEQLTAIAGAVPKAQEVAGRCAFSTRCRWVAPPCGEGQPDLRSEAPGRLTACLRLPEIRSEMREARAVARRSVHHPPEAVTSGALVRVVEVTKVFQGRSRQSRHDATTALAGVSLEIRHGESVGLVGESGSGKTTLARCLLGLETPTSGSIAIDGIPAADYEALVPGHRRQLRRTAQIVFQDPYSSLNPVMTVGATLKEALTVHGRRPRDVDGGVRDLLGRVGLPAEYAARKPVALSGGERQRVAIARALAVEPKLLVCDEPVSALDVSVQAQILNLFKSLRAELGMTYLFVSHDLAVVRQMVETVHVLYRGEIVESGPADDVFDHPRHWYTAKLLSSVPGAA